MPQRTEKEGMIPEQSKIFQYLTHKFDDIFLFVRKPAADILRDELTNCQRIISMFADRSQSADWIILWDLCPLDYFISVA